MLALTLLACFLVSASAVTASPAQYPSQVLESLDLIRVPLGDFGYIEYDPFFPVPDAERYEQLIRLLFDAFPDIDLPDLIVIHVLRFADYERVAVEFFGQDFLHEHAQDYKNMILLGFNTRWSLSDDLAELYLYQLSDELVVHEMLHHILHRVSPILVNRLHPRQWPQTLMNNHRTLVQTLQAFMGSPTYKLWLRQTQ